MAGSRRGPPYGGITPRYFMLKKRLSDWIQNKRKRRIKGFTLKKVKQRGLSINKNKRMVWLLVLKKEKIKALVLKRLKEKGRLKFKRMIKGVY